MDKFHCYLHALKGASFKKFFNVLDKAHEMSGKNKVFITLDMINCAIQYGAGYYDYIIFRFWEMNHAQRKTYVTRIWNKRIVTMTCDPKYSHYFDNKNDFYNRFTKYLGREYLDMATATKEQFEEFAKKNEYLFAKPRSMESGKGIEKLKVADFENLDDLYKYVKEKNFGTVEQLLTQHEALNKLYPLSINSLRITTLVAQGKPHVVYAVIKMGNEGKFVDNIENSGMFCPVDHETGEITAVAHTSKLVTYDTHPYTGVKLLGYKIPYVPEAIDLCLKAAMEIPEFGQVGWDVCITPTGPVIIEGNSYPGHDFWQLPEHTPDKIGLLPFYKKLIPGL